MALRGELIRLAYQKPELRKPILDLLLRTAAAAWRRGTVEIPLKDGTAEEIQGHVLGTWVVHIPTGAQAAWFRTLKLGRGYVEAIIAEEPSLVSARTMESMRPYFRMMGRLRDRPQEWQALDLSSLEVSEDEAPAPPKKVPKVKKKTFAQARADIFQALRDARWDMGRPSLKIPYATSPNGYLRLWFKKQAVYADTDESYRGRGFSFKAAETLSYSLDIRKMTGEEFLQYVYRLYPDALN
jgi:hypothetical protein